MFYWLFQFDTVVLKSDRTIWYHKKIVFIYIIASIYEQSVSMSEINYGF